MVVAIPVRDEAHHLPACLAALAAQRGVLPDRVVLLFNNNSDDGPDIVRALVPGLPFAVTIAERVYPPEQAHAGTARAEAMRIAATFAGSDGLLLTTDADGRPDPGWCRANLAAIDAGAEMVCGRAEIDPVDALAIPALLHEDDAAEVAYGRQLDEIHALLDPDPADPWPRHTEASGASIAATVAAWERAGGVPPLPLGEDRAFMRALRRVDGAIRHAPEAVVVVSGRTVGRARGGMAETMARRIIRQDEELDESLEPAADCCRRARMRAALRRLHVSGGMDDPRRDASVHRFARISLIDPRRIAALCELPFFGEAWEAVERESPSLGRRRVRRAVLERHVADAERILRSLRRARAPDALPAAGMLDGALPLGPLNPEAEPWAEPGDQPLESDRH
ncbi:glycosyltransferase [Rhizosaccharibacter radicis]|uniref:Glycosyltransferase n=1 Tax=Rhizosaccharibacter radicis TaxID=2782605 RepID=A0ABT1VTQ6_9PROT|nr:glycosyltransferase [Acetobacteraceae bacterium KSS12]